MKALDAVYRRRQLYLVRCDYRRTAWFRAGRPPPQPPQPAGIATAWLGANDWHGRAESIVCPRDLAAERFRDGGRCLILSDDMGKTAYEIWVVRAGTWIPWSRARVDPPAGYALVTGAWSRSDVRNLGLHRFGRSLAAAEACRMGLFGHYAGVERHEVLPNARANAAAGLYPYEPDGILVTSELFGLAWHRREPMPPAMVEALAEIVRQHPEQFPQ